MSTGKQSSSNKLDSLSQLSQVSLRDFWPDEAKDFTPWLAQEKSLTLLSESIQLPIDGVIQTEVKSGPYRADIVVGEGDSLVVIENQLSKTDHGHFGQLLLYATNHDAKTIVWIAKSFSDEYRKALDWLNDNTPSDTGFFGLEIELWQIGDSPPAPRFNVVCQPNQLTKLERSSVGGNGISETRLAQLDFWEDLRTLAEEKGSKLGFRKPQPLHWYNLALGRAGFEVSLSAITPNDGEVRCAINVNNFAGGHEAFDALEGQKEEIEKELGELTWRRLDGKYSQIVKSYPGLFNDDDKRQELLEWCLTSAEAFFACFKPRVEELDLDS
jgi:hypothetical protein